MSEHFNGAPRPGLPLSSSRARRSMKRSLSVRLGAAVPNQNDLAASPDRLSETLKQQILELCQDDATAGAIIRAVIGAKPDLAATVVQNLPAGEKQAAAAAAAAEVSNEDTPGLVATVVQALPAEQQQAAAAAAAAEVSNEATPRLVATVVNALPTDQKQAAAQAAMSTLSQDQRGALAASILGEPNPKTQQMLWYIVVGSMGLSIFVFGIMAFLLINWGKAGDAPLALATTALGGVVGLVASGPGRGRR
jgi:hypothetical protein